ncbi:MAG TPA: bifunctional folylpolyglutamate synthase/dihydrofolate synthase, partial [Nevskiaceae bacterium]|nr:bifunctional folylpolyglutamate synthase/dihydrofolate synthase [Nevskiaceae bacterium]
YNERVGINGVDASDADFCRAFTAIEQARGDTPLTYFEFGTLAALWLFREAQVDVQVLEVGLGGRLDAVNLVDADAAIVTSIGLDHMDWLGPDRASIAREKMGVARAGRPLVCAEIEPPDTIASCAAHAGARLLQLGADFDFVETGATWTWGTPEVQRRKLPRPGLAGIAQLRNAAGVLSLVHALDDVLPVTDAAIRSALPALTLPGRCQRIGEVIVDVAHNAQAAQVLADNLAAGGVDRVRLVLGMLGDKPVEDYCAVLAPQVERAYFATLPGPRGLSSRVLAQRSGLRGALFDDVAAALAAARAESKGGEQVVVTGSFLTVAAAIEELRSHG